MDYTLVKRSDGSWAPKAAPVDVSINGGGTAKEAAQVTFIIRSDVTKLRVSQGWTQITTITLDEGPVLGVIDV